MDLPELIPSPSVVREKLARNYEEAGLLRRLLKLAEDAAEKECPAKGCELRSPRCREGGVVMPMTPAPRRKPTLDDPGPVRLADAIDPPGDPRPEAKRGPTLPAGFAASPRPRPPGPVERCPPASSRCLASMTWPLALLFPPPCRTDAIRRQGSQA